MNYLGRLKSWIKAKINSSKAHEYKIEIAVLSAIILLFALSFSISASVRFFCKEHPGILIVVISVAGEIVCEWRTEKSFIERLKKFFGICLVVGLLLEIAEAVKSDKQVETMRGDNLVLQTNVAAMNGAVLQLAHQYDLSTNALAEANARLSLIKPLKERLVDCLNIIAPEIVAALKKTPEGVWLPVRCGANSPQIDELENLCREQSSGKYIRQLKIEPGLTLKENGRFSSNIDFILNPELLQ